MNYAEVVSKIISASAVESKGLQRRLGYCRSGYYTEKCNLQNRQSANAQALKDLAPDFLLSFSFTYRHTLFCKSDYLLCVTSLTLSLISKLNTSSNITFQPSR